MDPPYPIPTPPPELVEHDQFCSIHRSLTPGGFCDCLGPGHPKTPERERTRTQEKDPMNDIPMIELRLREMQRTIVQALTEHELTLSSEIKRAVEAYCTPENLHRVLAEQVRVSLDTAIQQEVKNYYAYGDGREAVKQAVIKRLTVEEAEAP